MEDSIYFYPNNKTYFGIKDRPHPNTVKGNCFTFDQFENAWRKWNSNEVAWMNISTSEVPNEIRLKLLLVKE